MADCFHCGNDDHLSYDCPGSTRRMRAPAAPGPAAGAESTGRPQPPPFALLYQRPAEERADPQPWADSIRELMGWSRCYRPDWLRDLAIKQVTEARAARQII